MNEEDYVTYRTHHTTQSFIDQTLFTFKQFIKSILFVSLMHSVLAQMSTWTQLGRAF